METREQQIERVETLLIFIEYLLITNPPIDKKINYGELLSN